MWIGQWEGRGTAVVVSVNGVRLRQGRTEMMQNARGTKLTDIVIANNND